MLGEDAKGEFHPRALALVSAAFPLPPGYEAEARCMFVRGGQQNIWKHLLGRQTGGPGRGLPGIFLKRAISYILMTVLTKQY